MASLDTEGVVRPHHARRDGIPLPATPLKPMTQPVSNLCMLLEDSDAEKIRVRSGATATAIGPACYHGELGAHGKADRDERTEGELLQQRHMRETTVPLWEVPPYTTRGLCVPL